MNKKYLNDLIRKIEFPVESYNDINETFDSMLQREEKIDNLIKTYEIDMYTDFVYLINSIRDISKELGINEYQGSMVFLILLSEKLKDNYNRLSIDLNVFYDTIKDLKWKLLECNLIYGVWGTFVPEWYDAFFRMYRFTLGRLQFEINKFDNVYKKGEITIGEFNPVLSIHIPRTLERLTEEMVKDSMSKASIFFDKILRKDVIPFVLYSWILHPGCDTVYKEGSNLYKFKRLFDMISYGDYDDYHELWRIFDRNIDIDDVDNLPTDSSLRRGFIEKIRRNEKIGYGFGIYLYRRG